MSCFIVFQLYGCGQILEATGGGGGGGWMKLNSEIRPGFKFQLCKV